MKRPFQIRPAIELCSISLALGLVLSGCLKTRAQLKGRSVEDEDEARRGVPAQVTSVEPSGGYAVEELKSEMTRLLGRVEDLERAQKQSQTSPAQKDEIKKLEGRIIELEQTQAQLLEEMTQRKQVQSDPAELFKKAKGYYDEGDFDSSVDLLTQYLKSPRAKKLEEATFLRGESYFQLKQYKKAIVDYSQFPEKFPKSPQSAAALYRIGQSFDALGMKEDAQGFYQELQEKFPQSAEAKKSKRPAPSPKKKTKKE